MGMNSSSVIRLSSDPWMILTTLTCLIHQGYRVGFALNLMIFTTMVFK